MTEFTVEENMRRILTLSLNQASDEELESQFGELMDSKQAFELYVFSAFAAPFVIATERATGVKGTLLFRHHPRVYFGWQENPPPPSLPRHACPYQQEIGHNAESLCDCDEAKTNECRLAV